MKKHRSEDFNTEDEEADVATEAFADAEDEEREPTDGFEDSADGSEGGTDPKKGDDALSEEELAWIRSSVEGAQVDRSKLPPHDTSDRATFFRFIKSRPMLAVASVIVAIAIVIGAVAGCALLVSDLLSRFQSYNIVIADNDPYRVSQSDAVINDVLYVDMHKIAEATGLVIGGSYSNPQFASIKNSTSLVFEDGSSRVYINGCVTEIKATTLNGNRVTAPAYADEAACLVPFTFLSKVMSEDTVILRFDEETKTVYIKPKYNVYDGDTENRVMKDLLFITDNFDVTIPIDQRPTYTYSYAIEIEPYLSSIDTEYLMLANKQNSIGRYKPERLKTLTCPTSRANLTLDYDAAVAVEAMMLEMAAAGIDETFVTSAYRDYDYQNNLYERYVAREMERDGSISREEAERRASVYSARPGESEHQTGLCLDFITADMGGVLDEKFEDKAAFEWLSKNAYKYGFILRYPKNKVDVTGYQYEPWHYRFVGRQAASEIYFSGMCFEEYLEGQQ